MPIRLGTIQSAADFNTFSFTLEQGQAYSISVSGVGSDPLSDAILTLLRNGNEVATDDDSGPGANPYIFYKPGVDTPVVVRVDGFSTSVGDYRLAVQADDYRNYVDAAGLAGQATAGGARSGALQYGLDTDIFAVKLEAGLTYIFSLRGTATGEGTLRDPILTLFSPGGTFVDSDDDGGKGSNARIAYTAETSGRYWLEADGFGVSRGSYVVRVSEGAEPRFAADGDAGSDWPAADADGLLAAIAGADDFLL